MRAPLIIAIVLAALLALGFLWLAAYVAVVVAVAMAGQRAPVPA